MNANEFRLGNVVHHLSFYDVTICGITKDALSVNYDNSKYWDDLRFYKPTLLNEKWLIDFGFNCINRPKMAFKLYHNEVNADLSSILLKEVGNNPVWVYSAHNRYTVNPFTKEINYVHELQNLYFSLTGKELVVSDAVL